MSMKEHINYAITKLSFSFSSSRVTPYGGLLISGQMLSAIDFDRKVDMYTPPAKEYSNSDILKSMLIGILCGNADFEAIHETMALSLPPLQTGMFLSISMSVLSLMKSAARRAFPEPINVRTGMPRSLRISGRKDTCLPASCAKGSSTARKTRPPSLRKCSGLPGRLQTSRSCSVWIPAMIPPTTSGCLWKDASRGTGCISSSSATSGKSSHRNGWTKSGMYARTSGHRAKGKRNTSGRRSGIFPITFRTVHPDQGGNRKPWAYGQFTI